MPKQSISKKKAVRRSKRLKMEKKESKKKKLEEEDDIEYYSHDDKFKRIPIETLYINEQLQDITPDINEDDPDDPKYGFVQNYTNQLFLVSMSEENIETDMYVNQENENYKTLSKQTQKPPGRPRKKIYRPPDLDEDIVPVIKTNSGLKKTEVPCNEKFHLVDVFSIFGKSVGDQLRSFPMDRAMFLQNKIQDLITAESFKT